MASNIEMTFELTQGVSPHFLFSPSSHHWMTSFLQLVSGIKPNTIVLKAKVISARGLHQLCFHYLLGASGLPCPSWAPCPQVQFRGHSQDCCPEPPAPNPGKLPAGLQPHVCGRGSCFTTLLRVRAWTTPPHAPVKLLSGEF